MSKKDKIIETIEVEDASLLPELLDGKHHVIPIVTGGDEVAEEVEVPEIIPILTLRSSVLFPGAITPITVGRDKSISLVRAVNAEGGILGAVLQRESDVEDPAPDDMYKVGTAARIIKILEMPNGNLTVILNGLEKIEIREYITTEPYFRARVTALRDTTPDLKSIEFEALVDSIRDVALNIINVSPSMPTEAVNPCEAVLMPMSGIRVVLSRLISAGVMANDETMTASALPRTGSSSKNSSRAPASPIGWMTRS